MRNNNFSNTVYQSLKESKSFSLKTLLKEEEDISFDFGDSGDDNKDSEGSDDEGDKKDKKKDDEGGSEGGTEPGSEGDTEPGSEGDTEPGSEGGINDEKPDPFDEQELINVRDGVEKINNYYNKFFGKTNSLGIVDVQNKIANDINQMTVSSSEQQSIAAGVNESYSLKNKNSIKYFLNEDVDVKKVEKDIEVVDNIIDKGTELIDRFKKGTEINITHYVQSAINAYRNFDSLFSKESIVKQATINLIILNSGSKAEENITEFEELFHEELHKQFGIEYEEYALITKNYHNSTGAIKQA